MTSRVGTDQATAPALVAFGLAMCLSLGTSNGLGVDADQRSLRPPTGWLMTDFHWPTQLVMPPLVVPAREQAHNDLPSMGGLLASIHSKSGLTWDQIARLFNVSRRSVHLWLAGGKMSAANEERLVAIESYVSSLDGDPDARRRRLLSATETGMSFFDSMRQASSSSSDDINRHLEPLVDLG